MKKNYKELLSNITTFVFDVDGVFTDGSVLITSDGELLRKMSVKDGYAVKYAISKGYKIAVISGGMQENVRKRLNSLGVEDVYLKAFDKIGILEKFTKEKKIDLKNILYMGDDNPDIKVLKVVGISTCPSDASVDVKSVCDYISPKEGGYGCVRDVIEQVMRIHNKWI